MSNFDSSWRVTIPDETYMGFEWRWRRINPHSVQCASRFQPRVALSDEQVNKYAAAMRRGDTFPPIRVARVGSSLCVLDGFHRVEAARAIGRESIGAYITSMSEKEAMRVAISANALHGLNLNRKDKRRCFNLYVEGGGHLRPDGSVKSLRQIRNDLENIVSHQTVSNWLRAAGIAPAEDPVGPNVSWADEEPDKSADLQEFEAQLEILEEVFHRLDNRDRATAGYRLDETATRLLEGEVGPEDAFPTFARLDI